MKVLFLSIASFIMMSSAFFSTSLAQTNCDQLAARTYHQKLENGFSSHDAAQAASNALYGCVEGGGNSSNTANLTKNPES